jgi:two-component system chemotaxis response regulator CheB
VRSRGVVAVGASAGGVEALRALVAGLSTELPAPVLVTQHIGQGARSQLPEILTRAGALPAAHARHGERVRAGRIYVAPPDWHLLVHDGVVQLSAGPTVNRHRPAVDVMFAGAVRWARGRTVAVVLSGMLDDGSVGAALVARAGGRVVVQDPAEAMFDSMPKAALAAVPAAEVLPVRGVGGGVTRMLRGHDPEGGTDGGEWVMPERTMADSNDPLFLAKAEARLTRLTCPDCSGSLAQLDLPGISYFRCHVGHQYSPRSLEAAQREAAEARLWAAVTALEEHAALARHLAGESDEGSADAAQYLGYAQRSTELARSVRSEIPPAGGEAS